MKILFVSRLFEGVSGGVERMAIVMMNELASRGHEVELLSWDRRGATTHYPLAPAIRWHQLDMGDANARAGWGLRLRRQWAIRRLLERSRPDAVIAFQHGPFLTVATAALGLRIPLVAAERNAPQRFDHLKAGKRRSLIFQTFRLATLITVQMEEYVAGYPGYLRSRIVSIPNPVQPASRLASPCGKPGQEMRLLTVGRLSYQKNQTVLIEAFAILASRFPEWRLVLVGTGEDEARLRALVARLGLADRVEFTGAVKDVESQYARSHAFCLSSRWEGFPNALAEAMAHGLPVVGYAGCAGTGHLIRHGETGLLAAGNGAVDALATTLAVVLEDAGLRERMGRAAAAAMALYSPAAVFDRWEGLFRAAAGRS
jgi:glycosyltransferase involved in cell wall biosynthesis